MTRELIYEPNSGQLDKIKVDARNIAHLLASSRETGRGVLRASLSVEVDMLLRDMEPWPGPLLQVVGDYQFMAEVGNALLELLILCEELRPFCQTLDGSTDRVVDGEIDPTWEAVLNRVADVLEVRSANAREGERRLEEHRANSKTAEEMWKEVTAPGTPFKQKQFDLLMRDGMPHWCDGGEMRFFPRDVRNWLVSSGWGAPVENIEKVSGGTPGDKIGDTEGTKKRRKKPASDYSMPEGGEVQDLYKRLIRKENKHRKESEVIREFAEEITERGESKTKVENRIKKAWSRHKSKCNKNPVHVSVET